MESIKYSPLMQDTRRLGRPWAVRERSAVTYGDNQ